MSQFNLAKRTIRDLRWQVVGYGLGLASMCMLIVFIYPSYRRQLADFQIPEALKPLLGGGNYGTAAGFLTVEFFSWGPLLGIVFAIRAGTALLGGEETNTTLDLLLSLPISRTRLLLEKLSGFAIAAVVLTMLVNLGWLFSVPFVTLDVLFAFAASVHFPDGARDASGLYLRALDDRRISRPKAGDRRGDRCSRCEFSP